VKSVFTESHLRLKAFETGFTQRRSKFSPLMFIDSLLYDASSERTKSLNQIAINTEKKYSVDISRQGIDQRYSTGAIKYVQALIGEAFAHQITKSIDVGWFKLFNRILIKDSTKFDVSGNLAKQFPGFGGGASKAAVSIQYEFDIKGGEVPDLNITPANRTDSKDASATIHKVKKGDLIIRDLGYSIICFFKAIHKIGAYFISRLNPIIVVYEMRENKLVELDFVKLHELMIKGNIVRIEKQAFIGKKDKFPVRLIIELMPEEVVSKRLQKVNAYNKKKGFQTSDKYKDRAHFNLFITNIGKEIIEDKAISSIYRIRWQVELIFKAWKSIFGIDNNNPMKYERLICLLNARLLLIMINWDIFMNKRQELYTKTGRLLSINKCFKTLQENSKELTDILTNNGKGLVKWIRKIIHLFESHHWLEKKKKKLGLGEILTLNVI